MEKTITMSLKEFEEFKQEKREFYEIKHELEDSFGYLTTSFNGGCISITNIFNTKEELFKDKNYVEINEQVLKDQEYSSRWRCKEEEIRELKLIIELMEADVILYTETIKNLKAKRKPFWEKYL